MENRYNFDEVLDRTDLSTAKWEAEFARLGRSDVLAFGTADMDFRSPETVIHALERCAKRGHFGYPYKGESYYHAAQDFFDRRFGWKVDRSWIQTATGVYASIQPILDELTTPGDEIIFQTPVHHIFSELVTAMGRVPIENPLRPDGKTYNMDLADLERKISSRTKAFLLCSPHNPMGRVWTAEELQALHSLCHRKEILIIADEIYSGLMYSGQTFIPLASLSRESSLNAVTLTSASKSFNLTGLKHSLVIAENPLLRDAYLRGQRRSNMYYGGSTFGQIATEEAFRSGDAWSEALMSYVGENCRIAIKELADIFPRAVCYAPQSTYFLWMDLGAYGVDSAALVRHFEEKANITVTSGHVLGTGGDRHIRLNLGCPRATLVEGLNRIRAAGIPT